MGERSAGVWPGGTHPEPHLRAAAAADWPRLLTPVLLILLAVTLVCLVWAQWPTFLSLAGRGVPVWMLLAFSFLLAFVPLCICVVQNVTRNRQLRRLESLAGFPVSRTWYFQSAKVSVDRVRTVSVNSDYTVAMIVYVIVLLIGFCTMSVALAVPDLFKVPNALLGGWKAATAGTAATELADYQAQTLVVAAVAFLGSYVYAIGRLLDRVNNNDLYPISLYFYTVRALVALFVAIVLRHAADTVGIGSGAMLLVAFGVGLAPDLFLIDITRRAFQTLTIWGVRAGPADDTHPTALPLLMVDDLSRDKIDRLEELGVDSAQVLANQNPLLLWPRLPFDLTLIVDWIAQAQLYALVREAGLTALRRLYVRDAFQLEIRLADEAARAGVCAALQIDAAATAALLAQLRTDPAYVRLKQVRDALADIGGAAPAERVT